MPAASESILLEYLQRSGDAPLYIRAKFDDLGVGDQLGLLNVLISHCHRWKTLHFTAPGPNFWRSVCQIGGRVPILEHVACSSLCIYPRTDLDFLLPVFSEAPRLRVVDALMDGSMPFLLPWHQLTHYRDDFELINDFDNRADTELWEDWMWEVCTWIGKMSSHDTELSAYRLLHRLQGRYIPRLYGVIRLQITPESTFLHPITDVVQGLVLEYIPGISMEKLKPGIDVSEQEAENISSAVLEGFRAIEAEKCLLHNDIHTRNIVLREGNWSPVIIDFGLANIRNPEYSDEEWKRVVHGGPDTRYMRRLLVDPEDGRWKRTVTLYHYKRPLAFNEYVESVPDDFRRATFERVSNTDWEGAREKMYQWRIKPGVRCRPWYNCA